MPKVQNSVSTLKERLTKKMGKSIDEIISAVDYAFEMYISEFDGCSGFNREETDQDRKEAVELIKSQQAEIERLKEQGKRKFLVKENGEITPIPNIVLCKKCKHRPAEPEGGADHGSDYIFPDSVCPCQCDGDPWYSWMPPDDWFCPKGEL